MNEHKYIFPKGTTFLVTGGAGFIGSNIVEELLKLKYKVKVLDDFSTGKLCNINEFRDNPDFELIEGDIRLEEKCIEACQGVDYIFHEAAISSVSKSIDDPKETNDINITGTLNMLIAAKKNNVKRFIYASSSSVYGDEDSMYKSEDKIGIPLSPYAVSKLTNEIYANIFYELYNLPTIGLRYFNVYGKNQDPYSQYSAVIPIFLNKLLKNEQPVIYGDGMQTRDFVFIKDIVKSNLNACFASEKALGKVFNISYGEKTSIIVLFNKICRLLDIDITPIYEKEKEGDIKHSLGNISQAKRFLDYKPQYNLELGLKNLLEWFKNEID